MCFSLLLQKAHRLLPTNLYVVLYNFKARHPDELDLTAGFKVIVISSNYIKIQVIIIKKYAI